MAKVKKKNPSVTITLIDGRPEVSFIEWQSFSIAKIQKYARLIMIEWRRLRGQEVLSSMKKTHSFEDKKKGDST